MTDSTPTRVGIYGGTFDPVHHGHLLLARDAVESLGLSRLIFVPAAISPHKLARQPSASGPARLQMLRAAIADEPAFEVDGCELDRPGPSYTVDTIETLHRQIGADSEIFYLIGEDNVAALDTWYRIEDLRALVTFVVFQRSAQPVTFAFAGEGKGASKTMPVLARRIDISATEIRNRVATGETIRYLVPEAVRSIIEAGRLYRLSLLPEPGAAPSPLKK